MFSDGRNKARSNYAPRQLGSSSKRLLTLIDGSHYKVKATPHQKKVLRLWIETGATYPGTYAALGSGMIGGYAENEQVNTDNDWATTRAGAEVIGRRCATCHDEPGRLLPRSLSDERGVSFWQPSLDDPRLNTSRHIVFNLSAPENSLLLLAPLSQEAGGWGLCRDPKSRESVAVLPSTGDPDYQTLLAMCAAGKDRLTAIKRFDMPGFSPRTDWVREMDRYGILRQKFMPENECQVYTIERRLWESLWHQPATVEGLRP